MNTIKVNESCLMQSQGIEIIPEQFRDCTILSLDLQINKLISLENCPKIVLKHFFFNANKVKSLEKSPTYVGKIFSCSYNNLFHLKSELTYVGKFKCFCNELTTFEFLPVVFNELDY